MQVARGTLHPQSEQLHTYHISLVVPMVHLAQIRTCELLSSPTIVNMGGMRSLLDALSLTLLCALRDSGGEELHEFGDGPSLVEGEAR